MNQSSFCLDPNLKEDRGRYGNQKTGLSPLVKLFILNVPRQCFLWIIYLLSLFVLVMLNCLFIEAL